MGDGAKVGNPLQYTSRPLPCFDRSNPSTWHLAQISNSLDFPGLSPLVFFVQVSQSHPLSTFFDILSMLLLLYCS
jgi:hypothetical protein